MRVILYEPFVLLVILCIITVRSTSWTVTCKTNSQTNKELYEVKPDILRSIYDSNDAKVTIIDCSAPETSYADFLIKNGLDVNSLETLILKNSKAQSETLRGKHFMGLLIKELGLYFSISSYKETLDQNILNVLSNLTTLAVAGVKMPPIPSHLKIVNAGFSTGLFSDMIGNCNELKYLVLSSWDVRVENLLISCPRLTTLKLSSLSDGTAARVIRNIKFVRQLEIHHCGLSMHDLQDLSLDHMVDLVQLDLADNYLANLDLICSLPLLQDLDLNSNSISVQHDEIVRFFKRLPQLRNLEVSYNLEFDFCKNINTETHHLEIIHPHLRRLVIIRTKTSLSCLGAGAFPSLSYLDLRFQDILVVQFQEFQISKTALKVNLWHNFLTEVNFTHGDYNKIFEKRKTSTEITTITLDGSMELDCDCHHGWFAEALRENLVIAPKAHCKHDWDETHLTQILPDQLKCDKFLCGDGCICRIYWTNHSVVANCTDAKVIEIPKVEGLSKLIAPFNRIVLHKMDIPDTLTFLDLRCNEILHVDEDVTKMIFSVKQRHILLSGNPILCDCDNLVFIQYIQKFKQQVIDYEDVNCAGNGTVIQDVILSDLCQTSGNLQAALGAGGAVLIAGILITVLYWHYGSAIHMFLYARGWLCCINEDKLDADRVYDAFVSYCFVDGVVAEEIVSWLEERDFKVCVHYRDWMPGEMIPTQIVRSVEVSRRTVILLSQKFIESIWGMLEFRTAHTRALKEGVMRVILVVLDDVVDNDNLDDDLRRYIRLNTYVRYDDPWFWDKLYYAMPRRHTQPNTSIELETVQNEVPHLPVITYEPSQSVSAFPAILEASSRSHTLNALRATSQSLSEHHDDVSVESPDELNNKYLFGEKLNNTYVKRPFQC